MQMHRRELAAGAALLAFGAAFAFLIAGLPVRHAMPNTPGPAFFPSVAAAAIIILSGALVGASLTRSRRSPANSEPPRPSALPAAAIGTFAAYLALLPALGFILATVPAFAALMLLYGCRSWGAVAAVATLVPVLLYTAFRYGFLIILPNGALPF